MQHGLQSLVTREINQLSIGGAAASDSVSWYLLFTGCSNYVRRLCVD